MRQIVTSTGDIPARSLSQRKDRCDASDADQQASGNTAGQLGPSRDCLSPTASCRHATDCQCRRREDRPAQRRVPQNRGPHNRGPLSDQQDPGQHSHSRNWQIPQDAAPSRHDRGYRDCQAAGRGEAKTQGRRQQSTQRGDATKEPHRASPYREIHRQPGQRRHAWTIGDEQRQELLVRFMSAFLAPSTRRLGS